MLLMFKQVLGVLDLQPAEHGYNLDYYDKGPGNFEKATLVLTPASRPSCRWVPVDDLAGTTSEPRGTPCAQSSVAGQEDGHADEFHAMCISWGRTA